MTLSKCWSIWYVFILPNKNLSNIILKTWMKHTVFFLIYLNLLSLSKLSSTKLIIKGDRTIHNMLFLWNFFLDVGVYLFSFSNYLSASYILMYIVHKILLLEKTTFSNDSFYCINYDKTYCWLDSFTMNNKIINIYFFMQLVIEYPRYIWL